MGQQVVTELVIDGDPTGGADKFSQAMASAEQAANSGTGAVNNFNLGTIALGAGVIAAGTAVKGFIDYIATVNKDLTDMGVIARQVGLTLEDFQGVKFGAALSGLNTTQINAGLEKSASLLNDASRNSNSLSKELDANGISVRNSNGQLISENQLLGIAANLIKNAANPGDQAAIAQMLGFTKEWIPLLEQGGAAMSALTAEAKAAGVVLDDELVKKAEEFDTEWRKSSLTMQANLKAALLDLLPYIDDLILRADTFVTTLKNRGVDGVVHDAARSTLTALGIDPDATHKIELDPKIIAGWDNVSEKAQEIFTSLKNVAGDPEIKEFQSWWTTNIVDFAFNAIPKALSQATGGAFPDTPVHISSVMRGSGESSTPDTEYDNTNQALIKANARQRAQDAADDAAGDAAGARSIVASKDTANDAVDRAINTLQRHTAAQLADAQAVGLGDAALAGFRADAAETAAVLANGGKETDAQVDRFSDLKDAAIAAADALSKAKVASEISRGSQTAFLTSADVQIANQLKGIYGNDIPAALASSEAAALRMNAGLKAMSDLGQSVNQGLFVDFETGLRNGKSAWESFQAAGVNALGKIADSLAKMAADNLWKSAFGGTSGSIFSSLFGGSSGGTSALHDPALDSAHGNAFEGSNVIPFARGGVVGNPTLFKFASGTGLMGESGPEAIIPLKRGSNGDLGIASHGGAGGSQVHVTVGVTVDNAGQLQAYVKNVSQQTTAAFVASPQFPDHVANASKVASKRRL